jgi:rRNA maturation endonuclease Nob1
MNIQKCDICKKSLKDDPVRAGIGILKEKDFCLNCGKPILDFLKKHKFINEDKIKK